MSELDEFYRETPVVMGNKIIGDELVQETFATLATDLSAQHKFPELMRAELDIVSNGRFESDDVFPMRQVNSRRPRFEFSHGRYQRFNAEVEGWLSDTPVASHGLESVSLFLFIGAGLVRPIVEDDQMIRFGRQGPRHIQVISKFYKEKKAIENTFEEILGNNPEGHKAVVDEIPDERVTSINGLRVFLAYLYAGYPHDPDKKSLFGELLRDSRYLIKETVKRERPDFIKNGQIFLKEDAQKDITEETIIFANEDGPETKIVQVADRLCSSVLPSWLIALATPVTKQSFGHLGSEIWDDKFYIEPTEVSSDDLELDDNFIFDDEAITLMPSTYTRRDK